MRFRINALAALAFATSATPSAVMADSSMAYCTLVREGVEALEEGPCRFQQYQGNVYVEDFGWWKFHFPAADQGKSYQRDNKPERISFKRSGYTLNVFWQKPEREPGGF